MDAINILYWNASGIQTNGNEFIHFIYSLLYQPDIICIQETKLVPKRRFNINGYKIIWKDRLAII